MNAPAVSPCNILEARRLTAGYEGRAVLADISLHIPRGAFVGITGPNGGGKTTLVKTLLGLLPPIAGELLRYDARGVATPALTVGYLPQRADIDAQFPITAEQVVLSGLMGQLGWWRRPSAAYRRQALALMEQVGIAGLRRQPVGTLSGGQLQRVLLARAVVASPELLVLDEPDSWLDAGFADTLRQLLADVHQRLGTTVLVVSHHLGQLRPLATHLLSVSQGVSLTQAASEDGKMRNILHKNT